MANLIEPVEIDHNQYEKISDDIYMLGRNMILRMNVTLGRKKKDGNRHSYHNEYMYSSNKYIDMDQLITVRRTYDFFMTLENITSGPDNFKNSIMIRPQDMYNIQASLDRCRRWFIDEEYKNLYAYSDKRLVIVDEPRPVIIEGLAADKRIVIEPTIISYENAEFEGVRMYVNDAANYVDITVDRFMGFIYLMNTIDMFGAAQNMISYLGRPNVGDNIMVFSGGGQGDLEDKEKTTGIVNRRANNIKKNKSRSFFDTIDDM